MTSTKIDKKEAIAQFPILNDIKGIRQLTFSDCFSVI